MNPSCNKHNNEDINDILTVPDKCLRCKSATPTIFCKEYYFRILLSTCDEHIHTLMSKQTHQRTLISSIEQNKESIAFPFAYGSDNPLPKEGAITTSMKQLTNANDNKIFSQDEQAASPLNSHQLPNDIKKIYQKEKVQLISKSFTLEQQLETTFTQ